MMMVATPLDADAPARGTSSPVAFAIGDVPVRGPLVLAPMSGYNDQPFRRLCRRFGAALVYTGLLSSKAIIHGPHRLGSPRSQDMLRFHPEEEPLVCQLFGDTGSEIAEAARRIQDLGMAVIDLNLGCAAPKVAEAGSGAALLRDPAKVGAIFARLTAAVSLPVTGKIRLGWDDDARNYLEVARVMEANGAAMIAVHGRTAEQAYRGTADWDAIAEVKAAVRVPVLASGDVRAAADIDRILAHTGCDGVMIGRAAMGNPWIFRRRDRAGVPWAERKPVIREHLALMVDFHGAYHGVRRFRKHLKWYLRSSGLGRRVRGGLMRCNDADILDQRLAESQPLEQEG